MEPTNEQIRKVLAEFMGFEAVEYTEDKFGLAATMGLRKGQRDYVPDYTHDLNSMHEVEEAINNAECSVEYIRALRNTALASGPAAFQSWGPLWPWVHATAEQRARAAYAVIKAQQEAKGGE